MVRELMHDPIFLARKSTEATAEDLEVARDLRIIVFDNEGDYMTMLNPVILKGSDLYETEEGCLSLLGGPRKTKRYKKIKVQYQNLALQTRLKTFTGWTAQIIQHEIDHCNGVLI